MIRRHRSPPNLPAGDGFRFSFLSSDRSTSGNAESVIPAEAGIHARELQNLDSGLRRYDEHGCVTFILLLR
jgi:hypothetical protein